MICYFSVTGWSLPLLFLGIVVWLSWTILIGKWNMGFTVQNIIKICIFDQKVLIIDVIIGYLPTWCFEITSGWGLVRDVALKSSEVSWVVLPNVFIQLYQLILVVLALPLSDDFAVSWCWSMNSILLDWHFCKLHYSRPSVFVQLLVCVQACFCFTSGEQCLQQFWLTCLFVGPHC